MRSRERRSRPLLPTVNAEPSGDDQPQVDSDWQVSGKVLVVDDDGAVCTTACAMLKHLGFETIEALGGREAIDLFERLHSRDSIRAVGPRHA